MGLVAGPLVSFLGGGVGFDGGVTGDGFDEPLFVGVGALEAATIGDEMATADLVSREVV